jgi:hypothetical protein
MLPKRPKTRTYRKLEEFFGKSLIDFGEIDIAKSCGSVDQMLDLITIFYDADTKGITKEEVEDLMDADNISPMKAFEHCISLMQGEPGESQEAERLQE